MRRAEGMGEEKDWGIKLFGRNIPLPECQMQTDPIPVKSERMDTCNTSDVEGNPVRDYDEEDSTQSSTTDEEKSFKKPDKILPCPRCKSLDTKFCYFNNYNVNQPRHFCKNCQRYWTAGGNMRNVPIGAGRRKNKHLVSADGIQTKRLETVDGAVFNFGPDPPALCESMETMLHPKNQKKCIDVSREDPEICGSALIMSSSLQCYPVPPFILPWNPCCNSSTSIAQHPSEGEGTRRSINPSSVPWYSMPVVTVPAIFPPNMPLQFLSASCWGSMPVWPAGTGIITPGSNFYLSQISSTSSNTCASLHGSPTLGKHCRDISFIEDKPEKCVLHPKTLRIDDSNEACRSPMWATLGTKPN